MAKILNSPNEGVAKGHLVQLQATVTKIKVMIVEGKSAKEIKQVIDDFCNKFNNEETRKVFNDNLTKSVAKMRYQYRYNTNLLKDEFIDKTYKRIISGAIETPKAATVDIQNLYKGYLKKKLGKDEIIEKFRGFITNSKKGLAIIENYQDKVKDQLRLLASEQPKYTDKEGRSISLRNKAEMAIRYEANMKDLAEFRKDIKLVWTSSHADASPRCAPFQGKLFSLDGSSGEIDGIKYEPIENALNENNGNSIINGYNCRHYLIEYEKGSKAPRHFTHKEIQKEYKVDQKQRNYENRIRHFKTEESLLRQKGLNEDADKTHNKWKKLEADYIEFSKQNERAYYKWRSVIGTEELLMENFKN